MPKPFPRVLLIVTLLLAQAAPVPHWWLMSHSGPAHAEDDEGGGDDGDDGDDGGVGENDHRGNDDGVDQRQSHPGRNRGFGKRNRGTGEIRDLIRNMFGVPRDRAVPQRRSRPAPVLREEAARNEIVAPGLSDDDLATLIDQGFRVIAERPIPALNTVARRLRIPNDVQISEARETVRALPSGVNADFNHYYRAEKAFADTCRGADCPARWSIGWNILTSRSETCGGTISIGMIDTGINETHDTFDGARLEVHRMAPEEFDASQAVHGTAVAALLVGDPTTRAPGIVPGARLVAVDAFHRHGGDERADAFTLIEGLTFLVEEGVDVVNLSLSGPENTALEEIIAWMVKERDVVAVAAVGNAGPRANPVFPAAFETVIAVTAIDRGGAIYRRAVQGKHVDLAAPGVNVWTAASISGARHKTGTSFAVPFVSAAAALLREGRPEMKASEVSEELRALAKDLGDPGHDAVFGAGRIALNVPCLRPD